MAYDVAGRMVSASRGGQTETYSYDGDGKRLTRSLVGGATTRYVWDVNGALPVLARESWGNGSLQRRYVHGVDLVSMVTPQGRSYFHHDGLGSVTDLTGAAGGRQWEFNYEVFGDLRFSQQLDPAAPVNLMRYTGQLWDSFTDTYHLRARQYDTHMARFTQTDPVTAQLGDPYVGSYVYVNNQPTVYTDPSGKFLESPYDYISFLAGVAVGFLPTFSVASIAAQLALAAVDIAVALNDSEDCDGQQIAMIAVETIVGLTGVSTALDLAGYEPTAMYVGLAEELIFEGLAPC